MSETNNSREMPVVPPMPDTVALGLCAKGHLSSYTNPNSDGRPDPVYGSRRHCSYPCQAPIVDERVYGRMGGDMEAGVPEMLHRPLDNA